MCSRTLVFVFVVLGFSLIVAPLGAQYNPPGDLISDDESPGEEALRKSLEAARWRWGIVRVEPWFGLSDASFVRSQDSSGSSSNDFTATLGAGLRGYAKTGRHLIWATHALPEYTWWQDNDTKTGFNGRYGLGLFGYFNRLSFEAALRRSQRQSFFSPEIQDLTSNRTDVARIGADIALTRRVHLYASHARTRIENREPASQVFGLLDQETEETQAGLRYRSPRGWWAGAGLEDSSRDFDDDARNLSHDGESELFVFGYDSSRLRLRFNLEHRTLEPREGSDFADLKLTTGLLETQWNLHRSVDFFLYGRRQLGFSVRAETSNYVSERTGVRLGFNLRGATLGVAGEVGADGYESLVSGTRDRTDDVTALAATLQLRIRTALTLRLGLTHTDYDSNIDGFDRNVTAWTTSIQLTGLHEKFRLGDGEKIW